MSILVAILGFNLLVIVHELGHYLFARWAGMRVIKFSIGFGPAIVRMESEAGTVYQFGAFPIGGYVQIAGMGSQDRHERGSYAPRSDDLYHPSPTPHHFASYQFPLIPLSTTSGTSSHWANVSASADSDTRCSSTITSHRGTPRPRASASTTRPSRPSSARARVRTLRG